MEERTLVLRARDGDEAAFEELVRLHQKKVYNLALRMTGNPEDACEVSQEAFLSAFRGLAGFQMESSFGTWIYRLTSNAAIDFLRKQKRQRAVGLVYLDDEEEWQERELPDLRCLPETELERKQLREAIQRGLDRLSPEHRSVLTLREIGGLSYEEIGRALSLEEGTVKSRIYRARAQLRRLLLQEGNFFAEWESKGAERG